MVCLVCALLCCSKLSKPDLGQGHKWTMASVHMGLAGGRPGAGWVGGRQWKSFPKPV